MARNRPYRGGIEIRKANRLPREVVEFGARGPRIAETGKPIGAQGIEDDQQDVGTWRRKGGGRGPPPIESSEWNQAQEADEGRQDNAPPGGLPGRFPPASSASPFAAQRTDPP